MDGNNPSRIASPSARFASSQRSKRSFLRTPLITKMGNKSSTAAGDASAEGAEIYLSEDLQAKVMNDFQSKHLKEEWENRQRAILASRNERIAEDERRRVGLEQELNVFRARNAETQSKLDAKIDSASARFADLQVELKYEVERVEKKIGQGGPKGADGAAAPCVALRTDLAACFREADDVRKCDGYVEALERCVKVEVVKQ